jgi:hypothetical protein
MLGFRESEEETRIWQTKALKRVPVEKVCTESAGFSETMQDNLL